MADEKILLSWEVKKEPKDATAKTFIILILVASALAIIYFAYQKDYVSVAAFVVLILVMVWYFFTSPKSISVVLTNNGIKLDNRFYKFEGFKSYWISERSGFFYLEPKGRVGSTISFPQGKKDPEEIKKFLPENLIEVEDKGDDFTNRIADILKI